LLVSSLAFAQAAAPQSTTKSKSKTPQTGATGSPGATRPDAPADIGEKGKPPQKSTAGAASTPKAGAATPAAADKFVSASEKQLEELGIKASRAGWVNETFITDDTDAISADFSDQLTALGTELAKEAVKFDKVQASFDTKRKLKLLKLALTVPAPNNPAERKELTDIMVSMNGSYGKGKYCPEGEKAADGEPKCYTLNDAEKIMRESTDPEQLKKAWVGWHTISPPYRQKYVRFVELGNKGAQEQGYKDLGALWRSNYDMPPDQFSAETERLWQQVKPLYDSLHAYVRTRLHEKYGNLVPEDGPIPAHLLGNMWSQEWTNIYPLVAPPNADPGYDLTKILQERKTTPKQMMAYGENFYKSLGMQALPPTFWERSMLVKPRDRDVVCHASAWDIDTQQDVRIKMCIEGTAEDFQTLHHELGHLYYDLAYSKQPPLYKGGANDGFHEAIGDTLALSVTPQYLKGLGLIDQVPNDPKGEINVMMKMALQKVAFLPFGKLLDQWRWDVFSGKTPPSKYNEAYWALRTKYQGVAPPVARTEGDFDPGAKFHIPANTSYTRYFLAHIYQFQFHKALCAAAGQSGPLHKCSIAGSKEAGNKLRAVLEMGASKPWPEAMKALTGQEKADATAILDYFAPLMKWLQEENKSEQCGW
jgi:peptidyl-dipeptidase A